MLYQWPLLFHLKKAGIIRSRKFKYKKAKIAEILATYSHDIFNNSTLQ